MSRNKWRSDNNETTLSDSAFQIQAEATADGWLSIVDSLKDSTARWLWYIAADGSLCWPDTSSTRLSGPRHPGAAPHNEVISGGYQKILIWIFTRFFSRFIAGEPAPARTFYIQTGGRFPHHAVPRGAASCSGIGTQCSHCLMSFLQWCNENNDAWD